MNQGNYEIYINGFTCTNPTWDDVLNGDGFGDEVFFVVNTQIRDGVSGALLAASEVTSNVAGDAHGFPNRIQAGSGRDILGSLRGGFVQGDNYPDNTPWIQAFNPAGRNFPPYKIWGDTLVQGESKVTFLTPTICELDPSANALQGWTEWLARTDEKFGAKAKDVFGGLFPQAKPIFDAVSLGIQTFGTLVGVWNPLGNAMTRPIGLKRDPNNPDGTLFNPVVLALTYDVAERLLAVDLSGKGKGIFGVRYLDDPVLRGDYQIWFEIRKAGGGGASGPRISIWKLDAGGQQTTFQEYGPFVGWTPVNCNANNILWRHDDGRASFWVMDDQGSKLSFEELGPFAGYTVVNYADGRILWTKNDGRISLRTIDDQGNQVNVMEHGPFPGFTAVNCANNNVLWRHEDGRASLWEVDDQGNRLGFMEHGPFPGFRPIHFSDGRILWLHDDGRISLWKVDAQGNRVSFMEHGPFAGWKPLNCANNNVLWRHEDGRASLWVVDEQCAKVSSVDYGPFPGWKAINYSDGQILWGQEA